MKKVRRKRCKNCMELFEPKYSTTQQVCSPICAYQYSKTRAEEKRRKDSEELQKLYQEKKNRKNLSTAIETTKKVVHDFIKLRDKCKPCISCGTEWKDDFDAGHAYSAKQFNGLRFHANNIHGQCIKCNRFLAGNYDEYYLRLDLRIGKEAADTLKDLAAIEKKQVKKWTKTELSEIRKYYRQKIKELEKSSFYN